MICVCVYSTAIDCARILGSPLDRLKVTDICQHTIDTFEKCEKEYNDRYIRKIIIAGRRGPAQASFTNKELREVINQIPEIVSIVHKEEFEKGKDEQSLIEMKVKTENTKYKIQMQTQ